VVRFWDFVFVLANTLLAILFGAAAGNMARGVPLDSDGTFSMTFFTVFTPRGYQDRNMTRSPLRWIATKSSKCLGRRGTNDPRASALSVLIW
jgi:hypothetical protein